MSMNYIEPMVETVSDIDDILGYFPIEGAKEWVSGLISENGIPVGIQDKFKNGLIQINGKNYKDLNEFKSFFLFRQCLFTFLEHHGDFITMPDAFPDCFDAEKISLERTKALSDWFTQKQDSEPEIFKPYVADILSGIHSAEAEDEAFSKAYQQKLQEIRNSSTFIERVRYYVRLIMQSLPKKDSVEKPFQFSFPNYEEFSQSEAYRRIQLIAELEEIPEKALYIDIQRPDSLLGMINDGYDLSAIPFLVCGKEIYSFVNKVLNILIMLGNCSPVSPFTIKEIQNDEDFVLLFKQMGEMGVPKQYLDQQTFEKYDNLITQIVVPKQSKVSFDGCSLFLDNLKHHMPKTEAEYRLSLLNENKIIGDEFDSIVQGSQKTEADWQKTTDTLSKEFINVITSGIMAYSADPEFSYNEKIRWFILENLRDKIGKTAKQNLGRHFQEGFTPQKFLNLLHSCKEPGILDDDLEYPFELAQVACEKDLLTKKIVLEDLSYFFDKYPKSAEHYLYTDIEYFLKPEEGKYLEEQTAFFLPIFEQAIQESEDSLTKLHAFLDFQMHFCDAVDTIFTNHPERLDELIARCGKTLHCFSVDKIQYDQRLFSVSSFVWEKTSNIWKALKPLLLAFRNSKRVLLNRSLASTSSNGNLDSDIIYFITIKDKEKLKELRYDMANDFLEYLKPAKKTRKEEQYTEFERNEEGFDLSYTEPTPFWRYAYCRALSDLGVKTDGQGHFFKKALEKVSQEDPSEDVRKAARKTIKELDEIRRGYIGSNHKKCLLEAFWWLRQAHMFSLGEEVDKKEASARRINEWR